MTYKDRLLKALALEKVDRPPVAVPTQTATVDAMREAGVFWPEALQYAEPMAKLAMACQRIYGLESIRVPFDISIEAETMGCTTRYGEESDPPVSVPKTRATLDELVFPDLMIMGRMAETIKAVSIVSSSKQLDIPLIAALGSPFEVLCTVYVFEDLFEDLSEDPGRVMALLDKILEMQVTYGKALENAGADVLMVVDGTSQTLMPEQFTRFSGSYSKKLIDEFQSPAILHLCGNISRLIGEMAQTGASALSIDWPVDISKARAMVEGKCALLGNLDVNTMNDGTARDIELMVKTAYESGLDIIAPGCGIIPSTPLENIKTYVRTVKSLGA